MTCIFVTQEDQGVTDRSVAKGDRVVQDHLADQAHPDLQDLWDFLEDLARLEDRDLQVTQVQMVGLE